MSGPIEVGQTWMRLEDGAEVRVTSADGHHVCFSGRGGVGVSSVDGFLRWYRHTPTIKLRIRVGVTADGTWFGAGGNRPDAIVTTDKEHSDAIADCLRSEGPVVAWHWITAEVPMPEVEQGEVDGEVEHG